MTTKKENALGFIKTHAPPIGTIPCFWPLGRDTTYATDPKYPDKLISLIERYRLDRYDLTKRKAKKEIESITTITDHKTHQVQKGDTLYSISKKYKVDLQLLVQENKIENNTIFLGQNLIIPQLQ